MMRKRARAVRGYPASFSIDVRFPQLALIVIGVCCITTLLFVALLVLVAVSSGTNRQIVIGQITPLPMVQEPARTAEVQTPPPAPVVATVKSEEKQTPAQEVSTYTIKRHDRLIKISEAYCNEYLEVAAANNIANPDLIYPGKTLTLKKIEGCGTVAQKPKASLKAHPAQVFRLPAKPVPSAGDGIHSSGKIDCDALGSRIGNEEKRILFRADCISRRFGTFINAELSDERTAVFAKAGLMSKNQARNLMIAMIQHESKGNEHARCVPSNPKRDPSYGLMQITPATNKTFGGGGIYEPQSNIRVGSKVIVTYTSLFIGLPHALERGLLGYNMGPYDSKRVSRKFLYRQDFDPRSSDYVRKVMHIYHVLESHGYASP